MHATCNSKKIHLFSPIILMCGFIYVCSNDEKSFEFPETEIEDPIEDDSNKIITINSSALIGQIYNFWSTRPMVNIYSG